MDTTRTDCSDIDILPGAEPLTEAEAAAVWGAGRARLHVEGLEGRELMAASLTATFEGGLLRIEGTDRPDRVTVQQARTQISVAGLAIQTPTGPVARVPAAEVRQIEVAGLGGNDLVT